MATPILPDHVYDLVDVSSPDVSPDGLWVVFVKTAIDRKEMTVCSQVMRQKLPDGNPSVFTAGPKDGLPKFAPDGHTLGFLRPDQKGKRQVWVIASNGGEARQVTSLIGGVRDFAWSPDATRLAVVSKVDPDDGESKYPKTQVVRRIRYRSDESGWLGDAFWHVFLVDVNTGEWRQVTDGEGDDRSPVWSPEGKQIAFVTDRVTSRDVVHRFETHVVSATGGDRACWSDDLSRVDSVAWSPDGLSLAVVGSHDAEVWDPRMAWLYVLGKGQPVQRLTDGTYTVSSSVSNGCWLSDGSIVVVGDRAGESFLCRVSADGGGMKVILGGGQVLTSLAVNEDRAVAISGSPSSPGDLVMMDLVTETQTRLTTYNDGFLKAYPPARLERLTFSRGKMNIQARVFLPHDFDASKTYPLVLDIHGGPNGRFSDSFDITHQVLVGAGYIVLAVNPRGSSSYGLDFVKAVMCDWGGEDFLDLMAAVDQLCKQPYVDRNRLGVHGYSYGGFMSSWIVGHDHRFKAAVVGAPCINLHSMYGTSDIGVSFGENQWGGSSLENVKALVERSPLTYVKDVQTPVLLMHGEIDYRCPIEQSEQFFVALKRQGKAVEFVRFPDSAHGFRRSAHPTLREEYLKRMLQWFEHYL